MRGCLGTRFLLTSQHQLSNTPRYGEVKEDARADEPAAGSPELHAQLPGQAWPAADRARARRAVPDHAARRVRSPAGARAQGRAAAAPERGNRTMAPIVVDPSRRAVTILGKVIGLLRGF